MTLWLLLISNSLAGDLLVRPSPPIPASGECARSAPITKGEPIPLSISVDGIAACSGVVEPTSSLAYLLAVEKYEKAAGQLYTLDIELLKSERDWYKAKYQQSNEPPRWIDKPATQRWIGRLEMLVTVTLVAGGVSAAYHYAHGVQK